MSARRISDFLGTIIAFIVLVVLAGALFPQYFGGVSQILLDNIGTIFIFVLFAIIIFYISKRLGEM